MELKDKIFEISCRYNDKRNHYTDFGIVSSLAFLYPDRKNNDIINIKFKISENQNDYIDNKSNIDYWGCYDFESKNIKIIYESLIQLRMATELWDGLENHRFKLYRLEIIESE